MICSTVECDTKATHRGMCQKHYYREWRKRNVEKIRADKKAQYEANREVVIQRSRTWQQIHPQQAAAHKKDWVERDLERKRQQDAQWRAANLERKAASDKIANARRRARLRQVTINDFTHQQWLDLLDEFDNACAYCQVRGVMLHREHMTPLSRGGQHTKSNIVPACGPCNLSKGTKMLFEFGNDVRAIAERGWIKEQTA